MDERERLRNLVKWRKKPENKAVATLGDSVKDLLENRIAPRQENFGPIADCWNNLLPEEVNKHCTLANISGGQLKVVVDSPSYLYELNLCSDELLKELQANCPRAKIKKIKFVLG